LLFLSLLAEELPGGGCKRKLLSSELKCGFDFSRKKSAALVSSIHQRREESPGWKMEADQRVGGSKVDIQDSFSEWAKSAMDC